MYRMALQAHDSLPRVLFGFSEHPNVVSGTLHWERLESVHLADQNHLTLESCEPVLCVRFPHLSWRSSPWFHSKLGSPQSGLPIFNNRNRTPGRIKLSALSHRAMTFYETVSHAGIPLCCVANSAGYCLLAACRLQHPRCSLQTSSITSSNLLCIVVGKTGYLGSCRTAKL